LTRPAIGQDSRPKNKAIRQERLPSPDPGRLSNRIPTAALVHTNRSAAHPPGNARRYIASPDLAQTTIQKRSIPTRDN